MSISLCMVVKNEEQNLDSFLNRIKPYIDEIIIIVDKNSIDNSKKIAKKHTKKVYEFKWNDDFSDARNFSIKKATKEWILWFDPDEYIQDIDFKKIIGLSKNKGYLGYRFIQETMINNKKYIQGICKMFQNNKGLEFIYPIHESVMPCIRGKNGKIGRTGIIIKHKTKYSQEKKDYYLKLISKKEKMFPKSSWLKEKEFVLSMNG